MSYGILGMFCIAFLEKMIPIVPSYVLLILLGMAASSNSLFYFTILATVAGSLTASMIWYCLGRFLGETRVKKLVQKYGKYIFFRIDTYEQLASSYRKNNFIVSLLGQIIPVARIYLALPAGILKLKPSLFLMATAIGAFIYNLIFLTIGSILKQTSYDPITIGVWALIILVLVEGSFILLIKRVRNRL